MVFFNKLDARTMQAVYSRARALLFPSLAEGFGWPLVEAQACGCPVITTDEPPMNEVAGDAAHYLPRLRSDTEIDTWAAHGAGVLCRLLDEDPARGAERAERGARLGETLRYRQGDRRLSGHLSSSPRRSRRRTTAQAARAGLKFLHVLSSVDPSAGGPMEGVRQRGNAFGATRTLRGDRHAG